MLPVFYMLSFSGSWMWQSYDADGGLLAVCWVNGVIDEVVS